MVSESLFLGILLMAVCILAVRAPHLFKSGDSMQTAEAEVLSRKGEMPTATLPTQWGSRMNYKVTFSVDGNAKELNASNSQYARLVEGSRGTLVWRNDTVVEFIPSEEKEI